MHPPLPPHTPLPVINNKPPGKGRGKGNKNKPANPLKLSVKSLTDKRKPRPCSSSAGREQFEKNRTAETSDPQGVIEQNQICLNSSNAPVAEVSNCKSPMTVNPSVAEAPSYENDATTHVCSDHSNTHSTATEVPLLGTEQGKPNLCLNSSNIVGSVNIVFQPSTLNALAHLYLATHHNLSDEQVNNLLDSRSRCNPLWLSALATIVFQKNYSEIDVDLALTNLTKYYITKNAENYDGPAPSLDLNALLKTLALKCKMEVLVPRVGRNTVNRWTKKVPHWSLLDPYLDVEDEISTPSAKEDTCESGDSNTGVYFTRIGGHVLRRWTRNYSSDRTRHKDSKFTFYHGMCSSSTETKSKPKRKPRIVPQRQPSASRIESQERILNGRLADANKLIRSYPLFSNTPQPESDSDHPEQDVSDSDPIPYVPEPTPLQFEELKQDNSPPVTKGKLVTKTFGVKKPCKNTSGRKYKCTKCKDVYDSIALLNKHFKDTHPPLCCKICDKHVNTRVPLPGICIHTKN